MVYKGYNGKLIMLCDSFIKVEDVTIRTDFSHPCSFTNLQIVFINLRGPDLPFEYNPWLKASTFFGSWKTVPFYTFRQASEISAKATSKCNPQTY